MNVYVTAIGAVSSRVKNVGYIELEQNTDLHTLKKLLMLPDNYPVFFTVNGILSPLDTVLKEGNQIKLYNNMSGG